MHNTVVFPHPRNNSSSEVATIVSIDGERPSYNRKDVFNQSLDGGDLIRFLNLYSPQEPREVVHDNKYVDIPGGLTGRINRPHIVHAYHVERFELYYRSEFASLLNL